MNRRNHYEAAFEAFLRERTLPYVAVDESKRALFSGSKLKSFDFVVYSRAGPNLLVDVKGRRAVDRSGVEKPLQTWTTRRDVDDLWNWERVFGESFQGLFAFVYEVPPSLVPPPGHFVHDSGGNDDRLPGDDGGRNYLMLGVNLADYRNTMSRRSAKWDTVSLPMDDFRSLARPMETWL